VNPSRADVRVPDSQEARIRSFVIVAALCAALFAAPAQADYTGSATAYHTCDGSTSQTADGGHVYFGQVASNSLPMHSWIQMIHPSSLHGRRFFRVTDRGGPGFLIDIYAPSCGWMNQWGRHQVTVRRIARFWRHRPLGGWTWRCCWRGPHWIP